MTKTALALLLVPLLAATALGEVHRGANAACYVPDGLAADAEAPVLIAPAGHADRLWPPLSNAKEIILLESEGLAARLAEGAGVTALRSEIDGALAFAEEHHPVSKCPKFLLGFLAAGPGILGVALADPAAFRGLVLVNARVGPESLPEDLSAARGFPVLILHGKYLTTFPARAARGLGDRLTALGLDVRFQSRDSSGPTELLGKTGAGAIAMFLRGVAATPRGVPTIRTKTPDGLTLTAHLYETGNLEEPILLLFHQARSSRGEYARIAPRLVEAGYNCLALDQRSGREWEGVANETAKRATEAGMGRKYADAKPDLVRAIRWARELGFTGKLALWGSSYSAALAMIVGSEEGVAAVVAFSPGDYLEPRGSVFAGARALDRPVLIVCPPNEESRARPVYEAVRSEDKSLFVQPGGVHGSSTIYRTKTGDQALEKVLEFLATRLR
jgi:dienelactone hydrolase